MQIRSPVLLAMVSEFYPDGFTCGLVLGMAQRLQSVISIAGLNSVEVLQASSAHLTVSAGALVDFVKEVEAGRVPAADLDRIEVGARVLRKAANLYDEAIKLARDKADANQV